ncbi:MAG: hypothetical protein RIR70_747 [Pseudomonadota bacterium]|jgi:NAD(P)-dependent dehydrogenase (short-subunit alcohol dehydrogenase family)
MRLQEKNIIITGAASGIGLAAVQRCLEEGARVMMADLPTSAGRHHAEALSVQYPGRCFFTATDVASTDQVNALIAASVAQLGRVDGVFNNAGIADIHEADTYSDEAFLRVLDVDLVGVFRVARAALHQMYAQGTGGSIVNVSSILGVMGQSHTAAYSAAKAGVVNLTHTLAIEAASHGVRVNAICPGYIETPMLKILDDDMRAAAVKLHPLGRFGQPREIADPTVFLLSDEASFITGAHLLVDGGFTAGRG